MLKRKRKDPEQILYLIRKSFHSTISDIHHQSLEGTDSYNILSALKKSVEKHKDIPIPVLDIIDHIIESAIEESAKNTIIPIIQQISTDILLFGRKYLADLRQSRSRRKSKVSNDVTFSIGTKKELSKSNTLKVEQSVDDFSNNAQTNVEGPKAQEVSKNEMPQVPEMTEKQEEPKNEMPQVPEMTEKQEEPKNEMPQVSEMTEKQEEAKNEMPQVPEMTEEHEEPKNEMPQVPEMTEEHKEPKNEKPKVPEMTKEHKEPKNEKRKVPEMTKEQQERENAFSATLKNIIKNSSNEKKSILRDPLNVKLNSIVSERRSSISNENSKSIVKFGIVNEFCVLDFPINLKKSSERKQTPMPSIELLTAAAWNDPYVEDDIKPVAIEFTANTRLHNACKKTMNKVEEAALKIVTAAIEPTTRQLTILRLSKMKDAEIDDIASIISKEVLGLDRPVWSFNLTRNKKKLSFEEEAACLIARKAIDIIFKPPVFAPKTKDNVLRYKIMFLNHFKS